MPHQTKLKRQHIQHKAVKNTIDIRPQKHQ